MTSPEDLAPLAAFAATLVASALHIGVPVTESDYATVTSPDVRPQGKTFFEAIESSGHPLTPGLWSIYLRAIAERWDEPHRAHAVSLPSLRGLHPVPGAEQFDPILDQAADVLACLGWALFDDDSGETRSAELMESLYRLAVTMKAGGHGPTAYDLAAVAVQFGPGCGTRAEDVARFACQLAAACGKPQQMAMSSAELAIAVAIDADINAARQLEAFDLCETALERIAAAPEPFREEFAQRLAHEVAGRNYLRTLLLPLLSFIPAELQPAELRKELGQLRWPPRVSTQSREEWQLALRARLAALQWDAQIDRARLDLEPPPAQDEAVADWTDWTVDHPSYRRAVPHMRSFMREAKFDENFVVLTHELTHVFSYIGALGMASSALRAATLEVEATIWSAVDGINSTDMIAGVIADGVAPLSPGNVGSLLRAEQALELSLKGRILQDVWAAWFEGLAIFGELSADPGMDPNGINVVTGCMRNLIDFVVTGEAAESAQAYRSEFEAFITEFEQRCSAAIAAVGPHRLRTYLDRKDIPYMSGYLAVRSVVSTWRQASGLPISGTDAFNLLLHATRYSINPFIPDLSLRSDLFEAEAVASMTRWGAALARVPSDEIAAFLEPIPRSGAGRTFRWDGMHLLLVEAFKGKGDEVAALLSARVRQALTSLSRPEDVDRIADAGVLTPTVLNMAGTTLRTYIESPRGAESVERDVGLANQMVRLNSMLPIGRTNGKFFLHLPPEGDSCYLGVQLRTTETATDDGAPKFNAIWFPVDRDAGTTIAAHYQLTASPRMEVTRLIDIAGEGTPGEGQYLSSHFFAYRYGDWFDVFGTTPAVDSLLRSDPEGRAMMVALARARLYPHGMLAAESKFIARGDLGALRTRDWIDQSQSWDFDEAGSGSEWARHVRRMAANVLDASQRRARQRNAGQLLLVEIGMNHQIVDALTADNFSGITEQIHHRAEIVDALLQSARAPIADNSIAPLADLLAGAGFPIFKQGLWGWDVAFRDTADQ